MSASVVCPHSDVHFALHIVHLTDTGGKYLEITGECRICSGVVSFPGFPIGLAPDRPMTSVFGNEIRLPFCIGDEKPASGLGISLRVETVEAPE